MMARYLIFDQTSGKLGGRSRSSLYRDIEHGRLPHPIKLGGRLYFEENALDEFLTSQACRSASKPPSSLHDAQRLEPEVINHA